MASLTKRRGRLFSLAPSHLPPPLPCAPHRENHFRPAEAAVLVEMLRNNFTLVELNLRSVPFFLPLDL